MTIRKEPDGSVTLQFEPALPCTTQECPNEATIGNASYDPRQNAWVLFPLCKQCLLGLMRKYGVDESEASFGRPDWHYHPDPRVADD